MTGEHEERDDRDDRDEQIEFDDGEAFILEDWEELDQVLSEVEKEARRQGGLPAAGDDAAEAGTAFVLDEEYAGERAEEGEPLEPTAPEDVLFSTTPGTGRQPGREQFVEGGAASWGGDAFDPAEIGIPVDDADHSGLAPHLEEAVSDEVHEVDLEPEDETEFVPEDRPWDPSADLTHADEDADLALAPELAPAFEAEEEYAEEEALPEEEFDPIYGAPAAATPGEPSYAPHIDEEAAHEEEEYAEYEESYVEAGRGWSADTAPRRRRPWRLVAGMAAMVLVGGGAATMVLKPEWLGMRAGPALVDRTEIARPELELTLAPPSALVVPAGPDPAGPAPINPVDTGPQLPTTDPVPVRDVPEVATPTPSPTGEPPVHVAQTESPTRIPALPLQPDDDVLVEIGGAQRPADPKAAPREDLVPVGEEMQVGGRTTPRDVVAFDPHPMAAGLVAGDQAFAQMHNGNFFVGNIKTLTPATVTLRVEKGEVTLAFAQLKLLGTASSPEFADIQNSRPGYVRLTNDNRLVGNIVKSGESGRVALSIKSQQIVIPQDEIEEVGRGALKGVRVTEGEDDAWIRQLVEQRLEKNAQTSAQPLPTPEGK